MAEQENATIREREDAELANEDLVGDDALAELERVRELETASRVGAHIILDLQDRGPLYLYLKQRRQEAVASLLNLAAIDPRDAVAIAQHQAVVREYLKITGWIDRGIERAKEAELIINEGYGSDDTDNANTEE